MRRALARCKDKHPQVVEYDPRDPKLGTCKVCNQPLIQWAVKHPVGA